MRTLIFCFALLLPWVAVAQTTVKTEEQWSETVTELMRKGDVPGLSIAVIRDGRVAWESEFGRKNAVNNGVTDGPVSRDTLFSAASMSKPVLPT